MYSYTEYFFLVQSNRNDSNQLKWCDVVRVAGWNPNLEFYSANMNWFTLNCFDDSPIINQNNGNNIHHDGKAVSKFEFDYWLFFDGCTQLTWSAR